LTQYLAGGWKDWAALGVSSTLAALLSRSRNRWEEARRGRADAEHYLRESVEGLRRELPPAFQQLLDRARTDLEDHIAARVGARRAELTTALEARRRPGANTPAPDREQAAATLRTRAQHLRQAEARATALLAALPH